MKIERNLRDIEKLLTPGNDLVVLGKEGGELGNIAMAIDFDKGWDLRNSIAADKHWAGNSDTRMRRSGSNLEKIEVWDFIIATSNTPVEVEAHRGELSDEFQKLEL